MDFLKSVVEDNKRKMFGDGSADAPLKKKKFQRRGELKQAEESARLQEEQQAEEKRVARRAQLEAEKDAHAAAAMGRKPKNIAVPEKVVSSQVLSPKSPSTVLISRDDAMRMLRILREPIQLFGETDAERSERVKKLQALHGVHEEEMDGGQRNDRLRDMEDRGDETKGIEMDLSKSAKKRESEQSTGVLTVEGTVARWLKTALKDWEEELEKRPDDVKASVQGKNATATQKQCRRYMKPLFEQLDSQLISADILSKLSSMIGMLDNREYQKAADVYLKLCIGNAPWPVGATSVGIHERAGRSRISESNIAHVMQDENTRKYLQSFKRIMTFLQGLRPNEDLIKNMG